MCVALGDVISNLYIIQTNNLQLLVYMNDIQNRGSKNVHKKFIVAGFYMSGVFSYDSKNKTPNAGCSYASAPRHKLYNGSEHRSPQLNWMLGRSERNVGRFN